MTAESSIVGGIAGRYATALFELANEAKALDDVAGDLATVKAALAESEDLRRLVRSPLVSREAQSAAMLAVLEALGTGDTVRKFIGVVARNRRLFVLSEMIEGYRRLLAAHRGEIAASVTSAKALTKTQLEALKKQLAGAMGRDVNVEASVDESLIGGLIVQVGSRMVDASVRTKLQNLKYAMKGIA
ncbi:F0F1 ATP synthase subunit delta [Oceanibacterium hippocampi]|uniref:ATP synthase subunit delta n=1 Tax=Oceanibacterium hippocampi TaxID=745714 RepID=A0A1Y5RBL4_9PROT|nr:F0F1 ATP synthase subunit delta [Oceanibacterium hippocampi]SLN13605.1 ATP synthase subunit delta [Oceanibacterium hippocampi]